MNLKVIIICQMALMGVISFEYRILITKWCHLKWCTSVEQRGALIVLCCITIKCNIYIPQHCDVKQFETHFETKLELNGDILMISNYDNIWLIGRIKQRIIITKYHTFMMYFHATCYATTVPKWIIDCLSNW